MDSDFLDYQTFKDMYPDKKISDWLIYSKKFTYNETKKDYLNHKAELTNDEKVEVEQYLAELKKEYGEYK